MTSMTHIHIRRRFTRHTCRVRRVPREVFDAQGLLEQHNAHGARQIAARLLNSDAVTAAVIYAMAAMAAEQSTNPWSQREARAGMNEAYRRLNRGH